MKKILLVLFLTGFVVLPAAILAQHATPTAPDVDVMDALARITNWAFAILLLVAAMFIIFAGFTYVTAGGDAEKIKTAHDAVKYALVAVAVGVLAKGLVVLVQKIVGG